MESSFYKRNKRFVNTSLALGISIFALVFVIFSFFLFQNKNKEQTNKIEVVAENNRAIVCDISRLVRISPIAQNKQLSYETKSDFKNRLFVIKRFRNNLEDINCNNVGITSKALKQGGDASGGGNSPNG